ncbi:MAG: hypothetical protein KF704_13755 [Crocinitomicaceae bacterium]|nr:hypothetical protein [Crocinitomicaceae bacterium]
MDILLIQILLGIGLFFLINWIGKHSYSIGYMEISIFVKTEEAPALNFLIRVLTPVVYIIIVSTILYYFRLDKYVWNIFLVNVYYIIFRLFFNLITNRGLLLNWYRQFLYWGAIVIISYFTYDKLIKVKTNILPDFTTVANELWIIILIFIFQVTNNIRLSQDGTVKRKQNYLKSRYNYFKKLYGKNIKEITQNEVLEAITYAILIYEDFNRPKFVRIIESIKFRLTKKQHTLGVMQVSTTKLLTDSESVILGTTKIVDAYKSYLNTRTEEYDEYYEWSAMNQIIEDYNTGESYVYEVTELAQTIKEEFYKTTNDTLVTKKNRS